VLIVTDNSTRQCYDLPLFRNGAHVTAEQVVDQLRNVLPAEVQLVISDRGTHFTAQAFAQLAQDMGFMHVPIARHRPETNGIAERCVRTLSSGCCSTSGNPMTNWKRCCASSARCTTTAPTRALGFRAYHRMSSHGGSGCSNHVDNVQRVFAPNRLAI
jgi:Integrase core domain